MTKTILVKGRVFPKRSVGIIFLDWANWIKLDKGENSEVITYQYSFFFTMFLEERRKSKKRSILLVANDRDSLCYCAVPNNGMFCFTFISFSCVLQYTKLKMWHCDTVPRKAKHQALDELRLCNPQDTISSNIEI